MFTPNTPDDAELERQLQLMEQLPADPPPVPFDMGEDFPELDSRPEYSTEPAEMRTIALSKIQYATERTAKLRAREICLGTGERVAQWFQTATYWVARAYKPVQR